ncbi:hypothetical protein BH09PSE5_BH09PSE5_35660 [soil metagenome]
MAQAQYENAKVVKRNLALQSDGGGLLLQLLHGEGPAVGHMCIHRVATDANGRLKSDIVYFYGDRIDPAVVESDFDLLCRPGLMSVSQLHHTASMLNRGARTERS